MRWLMVVVACLVIVTYRFAVPVIHAVAFIRACVVICIFICMCVLMFVVIRMFVNVFMVILICIYMCFIDSCIYAVYTYLLVLYVY